ncbi:MAG: Uma2 family endonuclease [Desulfitobacteriaceae bacterium]
MSEKSACEVECCDKTKLDAAGCIGAPDFIIEIVSPSTASLDYIKKLSLYERHRVKEYWILQPVDQIIMVYELNENGQYGRPRFYDIGYDPNIMLSLPLHRSGSLGSG